jgi:hypothetical protein
LYKAYGLKELDFRRHILVQPFEWDGMQGRGAGYIEKGTYRQSFRLIYGQLILPDEEALFYAIAVA